MPTGNEPTPSAANDTLLSDVSSRLDQYSDWHDGPLAVAVSGGSDSTALLLLATRWAESRGREIIALSVDHMLREESAAEIQSIKDLCARLSVEHKSNLWRRPPAALKVTQADARAARYGLLAAMSKSAGAQFVLTGHTLDDDLETFLIRARSGSGWYGLAGMSEVAPLPVWPTGRDVLICRPLLKQSRQALRDWLVDQEQSWIDDPSNKKPKFERVRVRQAIAHQTETRERIHWIQSRFKVLRQAEDQRLASYIATHLKADDYGAIEISGEWPDQPLLERVLFWLCQVASGNVTPPRGEELKRLARQLRSGEIGRGATLGGARLWKRQGVWWAGRDPGAVDHEESPEPGRPWDRRFGILDPLKLTQSLCDLQPNLRRVVPSQDGMLVAAQCIVGERLERLVFSFDKFCLEDLSSYS